MVFPRKRPAKWTNATAQSPPTKILKPQQQQQSNAASPQQSVDTMVTVLADAGCTLINPIGPPCLPSDLHKFRFHLNSRFSDDSSLRSEFLLAFSSYINSPPTNLRRVLLPSNFESSGLMRSESLVRALLLVPSIQLELQNIMMEKLPEYFDGGTLSSLNEDVARLILNQFRWLDFLVDSEAFTEKLFQVLSVCPLHLKKEIIGSLPEIIGDKCNKTVIDSLHSMLQEDSSIIVPVLDCFTNLNLDDLLQQQVISIALSGIRTIDVEHMPYLVRFLLLSANTSNARRIISQIREQLKFVGTSNIRITQQSKLKGKSVGNNAEASILLALRSSLQFKNILCQEILKELKSIEKARDHKVIDIWLLTLIYMNGDSLQKVVEKLLKKKIIEGCIEAVMFEECIHGNKDLAQDYLSTFLSMSEYLLTCKEQKARDFGIHMCICLFEEFIDTYSRQEVLGALVTHVGSGIIYEVNSALEAILMLALKHSQELIPIGSHLTGILDYLEGFTSESLHKVYEIFSILALSARSSAEHFKSAIANELLMIVRKQVINPDLMYKRMGLIGTMKIVCHFGDSNNKLNPCSSQKPNFEEALELLKTSLESCKLSPLSLILFYEELVKILEKRTLHPAIMELIGRHVGEFESTFLCDLENGQLLNKNSYCGLEGELWMNLDGDISPICLNILPLVSSSLRSAELLQILPANFVLLSVIERLQNEGSLGGIDALLGCPLHLPSPKIFSQSIFKSLSGKQKQIVILCLYFAANWIRELLNAFSSQITQRFEGITQASKEEIIPKLVTRLRNLVFLESLLNSTLKQYPLSLPELNPCLEPCLLNQSRDFESKGNDFSISQKKKKNRKNSKESTESNTDGKLRQQTIMDVLKKAGTLTPSQQVSTQNSTGSCSNTCNVSVDVVEISAATKNLEEQRNKFRPLLFDCFSILAFSKEMQNDNMCCADPDAKLGLHLYILRDLNRKIECFNPLLSKQNPSNSTTEFLNKIKPLFPCLRKYLDCALCILKEEGSESCDDHWNTQSGLAGNPDVINITLSKSSTSGSLIKETLNCFVKVLNLCEIESEKSVITGLFEAFQASEIPESFFQQSGKTDSLHSGVYCYLQGIFDIARSNASFTLASQVVLALESLLKSIQNKELIPYLRTTLWNSAQQLLKNKCHTEDIEDNLKTKGEMMQKILRIYLDNSESSCDLLSELVCSTMTQMPSRGTQKEDESVGFATLTKATFAVWYRVMHEENLTRLNNLIKEVGTIEKPRAGAIIVNIDTLLNKLHQSVIVIVSLVNMCKTHEKLSVRSMGVKYGGKFIDSFLKLFDFLQKQFQQHNDLILQTVRELQKATRIIQTLCSEAKGLKQSGIISKVPATRRSMERFLFHVKALLHNSSSGCTFWMGNLKHKDLTGHVVSSQAYVDENNDITEDQQVVDSDEDKEEEL